jgi:undecaprenyl-diphosphatase
MELDRDVYVWVVDHRVPPLDWLFVALTAAGYAGLLWIVLAAVLTLRAHRPVVLTTALVAATVWCADLVTLGLKDLVGRKRPYETVLEPEPLLRADIGQSFPSGHAATSFAGAVLLAYFFPRLAPAFLALAALVAFSRVYVGAHYPADVLAGAAVGTLVAFLVIAAFTRLRPRSGPGRRRSEAAPPAG